MGKAAREAELSDTEIEHRHRRANSIETRSGDYLGARKRQRPDDGSCASDSSGMCLHQLSHLTGSLVLGTLASAL